MTGRKIKITGMRFDKKGNLVADVKWLSVSKRLQQKNSKKVKPARRGHLVKRGTA